MAVGSMAVFAATLAATFLVTLIARRHARRIPDDALSSQGLNRWLIGLSAGATSNSGFIVTAGVAMGYVHGLKWLLLPLAWLVGDLLFWRFLPGRINRYGAEVGARTITDLILGPDRGRAKATALLVGAITFIGLTGYTSAQWLAGQKFVSGAFGFGPSASLAMFALVIVAYTAIGGFRGSIYADSLQAVIRVLATVVALVAVTYIALRSPEMFGHNIAAAGADFLNPFAYGPPLIAIGAVIGFAAAALGFGLGQPQLITRYLAGRDPHETQAAWWIYLGFVHFTWLSMLVFGLLLRGLMPELDDPETGLSVFFADHFGAIVTGVIIADIFATIAATSNSLLVAIAQSLKFDVLLRLIPSARRVPLAVITLLAGAVSMGVSLSGGATVLDLVLNSIGLMAAGLAPAVLVRILGLQNTELSIALAIVVGIAAAIAWKVVGLDGLMNQAGPGMAAGFLTNIVVARLGAPKPGGGRMMARASEAPAGRGEG